MVIGHSAPTPPLYPPAVIIEFEVYNMPGPDDAQMYTLTIRDVNAATGEVFPGGERRILVAYGYEFPVNASDIQGYTAVRKITGGGSVRTRIYPFSNEPNLDTYYVTITGDTEVTIKYGAPRTLTRRHVNLNGGNLSLSTSEIDSVITLPHGTLLSLSAPSRLGLLYQFNNVTVNGVNTPVGPSPWFSFIIPLDGDTIVLFRYRR